MIVKDGVGHSDKCRLLASIKTSMWSFQRDLIWMSNFSCRKLMSLDSQNLEFASARMLTLSTAEHKAWEKDAGLVGAIGSTGSGSAQPLLSLAAREAQNFP
ncbi:hypothetical protein ACVOMV_12905 [Mesorhizobium atlanticum]